MSDDIEKYKLEYWDFEDFYGSDRAGELLVARTLAEMALSLTNGSRVRCLYNSLEFFLKRFIPRAVLASIDVRDFGIYFRVRDIRDANPIDVHFGRVARGKEGLEGLHLSFIHQN